MVLVSCTVLPHGAMILDMDHMPDLPTGARELHDWCVQAGEQVLQADPSVIVLFTPHGLSLQSSVTVLLNSSVKGSAEWAGNWAGYEVEQQCDTEMAEKLLSQFVADGVPAEGLLTFAGGVPAPLRWGEAVPLWFLQSTLQKGCKVVVVCWPQTRFQPDEFAAHFCDIGKSVHKFATENPQRISIVFSCDLSHVHGNPLGAHCLYCGDELSLSVNKSLACSFDSTIVRWAETLCAGDIRESAKILLEDARSMSVAARSCGWAGLCCLQGLCTASVEAHQDHTSTSNDKIWTGQCHGYHAPTYYGMIVISMRMLIS
jgi:aromatic ring-opening dioxygenase LigB subunit